jgi:hypothetical protein
LIYYLFLQERVEGIHKLYLNMGGVLIQWGVLLQGILR